MAWNDSGDVGASLRQALERHGQLGPGQTAGRFWPVACIALEVTQRCNLDCTLCYLSEQAEAAHDVPLPLLLKRVDDITRHYGRHTTIQITGGDPTLRSDEDLVQLCRHIRAWGLRSCLMTNGIRARRPMLMRLAAAGLDDVAFHIDMTQERHGYGNEVALNALRRDYLERADGLGLRVMFNTTVFDGNLAELSALARFFLDEADRITLASFQLQTATGRGVLGGGSVTKATVTAALEEGFETSLGFGTAEVGHGDCTRYASLLVAGGAAVAALSDRPLFARLLAAMERHAQRSGAYVSVPRTVRAALVRRPWLTLRLMPYLAGKVWRLRGGLWRSRGRLTRLTVMLHDFMPADALVPARCESCVFMVATADGPVSMCQVNADRDAYVFAPVRVEMPSGHRWWSAATGRVEEVARRVPPAPIPPRRKKGRAKAQQTDTQP